MAGTFMGLAVPLFPDGPVLIDGQSGTAADNILVLESAASQTGDFIVCRNSSEVEKFVVEDGGGIVIVHAAVGDIGLSITQAAGVVTGDAIRVLSSAASKIFQVNAGGQIATMVLETKAVASIASNASASFSLTGVTTDSAIVMIPLKALTTGNGIAAAYAQGTTRVDVYALGGSVAANTYAVWGFKTVAN